MSETEAQDAPATTEESAPDHINVVTPVMINMGKLSKKKRKAFKKGKGPMMDEVLDVLEAVAVEMGDDTADKVFVPIVMVCEKKEKKKRTLVLPF